MMPTSPTRQFAAIPNPRTHFQLTGPPSAQAVTLTLMIYRNRIEAGRVLADHLRQFRDHPKAIVLALPRGGVPVGFEIASSLQLPFDVFLVRKLGTPGHSELAMGAIASGGVRVINSSVEIGRAHV